MWHHTHKTSFSCLPDFALAQNWQAVYVEHHMRKLLASHFAPRITGKQYIVVHTCENGRSRLRRVRPFLLVRAASLRPFDQLRAGAGCASHGTLFDVEVISPPAHIIPAESCGDHAPQTLVGWDSLREQAQGALCRSCSDADSIIGKLAENKLTLYNEQRDVKSNFCRKLLQT